MSRGVRLAVFILVAAACGGCDGAFGGGEPLGSRVADPDDCADDTEPCLDFADPDKPYECADPHVSCETYFPPPQRVPVGGSGGSAGTGGRADRDAGMESCDPDPFVAAWADWPMPNPVSSGLPNPAAYTDLGDGIVRDDVTGLEWEQPMGEHLGMSWELAKQHCDDLVIAGLCDFRLPSRIELVSLLAFVRPSNVHVAVDAAAFPNTTGQFHWSASLAMGIAPPEKRAWRVDFATGYTINHSEAQPTVRCVRGVRSQTPPPDRYEVAAATVRDLRTGLLWQRAVDAGEYGFADAEKLCDTLELDGTGWRVPSMKEVQTLIDEGRSRPAFDPDAFPDTPVDYFWSSSVRQNDEVQAWMISSGDGTTGLTAKDATLRVRCVR